MVGVFLLVVVGIGTDGRDGSKGRDGRDGVGAIPGPDVYQHLTFFDGFTKAGRVISTTTSGSAVTLTTNEFNEKTSYLEINPNNPVTITLMASSSAPFSNLRVGQSLELITFNASTSAALITWAEGTGIDIQEDEGETVTQDTLAAGHFIFLKKVNTDIIAWFKAGQPG